MTEYARQWNEIRKEAGLGRVLVLRRAPHGLHADAGGRPAGRDHLPQVGHISAQVMKRYSHLRRHEFNRAAAALEPKFLKNVLVITPGDTDGATVQ